MSGQSGFSQSSVHECKAHPWPSGFERGCHTYRWIKALWEGLSYCRIHQFNFWETKSVIDSWTFRETKCITEPCHPVREQQKSSQKCFSGTKCSSLRCLCQECKLACSVLLSLSQMLLPARTEFCFWWFLARISIHPSSQVPVVHFYEPRTLHQVFNATKPKHD